MKSRTLWKVKPPLQRPVLWREGCAGAPSGSGESAAPRGGRARSPVRGPANSPQPGNWSDPSAHPLSGLLSLLPSQPQPQGAT